jgi:hypothetical protein
MTLRSAARPFKRLVTAIALPALLFLLPRGGSACNSPLVLDLDGDGLYTTGIDEGVLFDLDGDGSLDRCGWLDRYEDDAFLVLDLNGNQIVDSGREMFGDSSQTPDGASVADGFQALAYYDLAEYGGNGDHKISARDLVWSFLRLWIDRSYDGISSPEELFRLEEWRVDSIRLGYRRRVRVDGNGNYHAFWGKFSQRDEDGSGRRMGNVVDIFFLTENP